MRPASLHSILTTTAFLISGAAALVYQIVWQRLLVIYAGADMQAASIIVTAFMLGLGVGSLLGGKLADRFSARGNLFAFTVTEALIGLWGLGSQWLYYDLLCQQLSTTTHFRPTTLFLILLTLLPPTLLMGVSLPLLTRSITLRLPQTAARIGLLYGINTLGAAAGALLTVWLILPRLGIQDGLSVAALGNMLCVFLILPLFHPTEAQPTAKPAPPVGTIDSDGAAHFRMHGLLYAASGFLALGLEMVWFRVLGVMIKSTAFTFGTLLGIYLGGLGLGSLLGSLRVHRSTTPLLTFLRLQAALPLLAGLSLMGLLWLIHHTSWLPTIQEYLGSYEPLDAGSVSISWGVGTASDATSLMTHLYLLLPFILIGPATVLMGASLPYLQKSAQTDVSQIGQRLGWLQAANITGSLLGTVVVSWIFIPYLGSAGTCRVLVLIGVGFGFAALAVKPAPTARAKALWAAASIGLLLLMPRNTELWAYVHGTVPENLLHTEDSSGISAVQRVEQRRDAAGDAIVFVNGIGQSWLPYGGIHSTLGALPALLHPRPERIAVIGLGSGDTAYSAAARYETEKIHCIEIIGGQLETLRKYHSEHATACLAALLDEKRIAHVQADGRRFLKMTDLRFDIIEADALRPNSAGSGNLYSEEYFQLLRRRLRPGGYAVTWAPSARVCSTFIRVFPHVLDLENILIGSPDPIQATAEDLRYRLGHLEVREHFRRAGIPIRESLAPYTRIDFKQHLIGPDFDRSQLGETNTDLFPRDEFARPD